MRHHSAEAGARCEAAGGAADARCSRPCSPRSRSRNRAGRRGRSRSSPRPRQPAIDDKKPVEKVEPKKEVRPPGKKIAFSMESKPWTGVYKWVAEQTGVPVIWGRSSRRARSRSPALRARRMTSRRSSTSSTRQMLAQKYYLLRKDRNWLVVPADDKLDPRWLPTITVEELSPERRRNEIVRMPITLKTIQAVEIAPEIKKLMGPFNEVCVLERFNMLWLQDTAANLRRVKKILDDLESKDCRLDQLLVVQVRVDQGDRRRADAQGPARRPQQADRRPPTGDRGGERRGAAGRTGARLRWSTPRSFCSSPATSAPTRCTSTAPWTRSPRPRTWPRSST